MHNPEYISVAIEDLNAFDAELSDKIRKAPADYLPLVFSSLGSLKICSAYLIIFIFICGF